MPRGCRKKYYLWRLESGTGLGPWNGRTVIAASKAKAVKYFQDDMGVFRLPRKVNGGYKVVKVGLAYLAY